MKPSSRAIVVSTAVVSLACGEVDEGRAGTEAGLSVAGGAQGQPRLADAARASQGEEADARILQPRHDLAARLLAPHER